MRKVNETVDFTLTGADSQLSDIEYRGVEEFSFKQFQMSSARHMRAIKAFKKGVLYFESYKSVQKGGTLPWGRL